MGESARLGRCRGVSAGVVRRSISCRQGRLPDSFGNLSRALPAEASSRYIRGALYGAMEKGSPDIKRVAAEALAAMGERGLLLAARDAGIDEARQVLLELDRPRASS